MERLYAVLTARFHIALHPSRYAHVSTLIRTGKAIAILHNMVTELRRDGYVSRSRRTPHDDVSAVAAATTAVEGVDSVVDRAEVLGGRGHGVGGEGTRSGVRLTGNMWLAEAVLLLLALEGRPRRPRPAAARVQCQKTLAATYRRLHARLLPPVRPVRGGVEGAGILSRKALARLCGRLRRVARQPVSRLSMGLVGRRHTAATMFADDRYRRWLASDVRLLATLWANRLVQVRWIVEADTCSRRWRALVARRIVALELIALQPLQALLWASSQQTTTA